MEDIGIVYPDDSSEPPMFSNPPSGELNINVRGLTLKSASPLTGALGRGVETPGAREGAREAHAAWRR